MRYVLLGAALLASGCSLVFSGDEFEGITRRVEVAILPEEPRTTDDLEVAIKVPSLDGQGRAIETYEYRWFRKSPEGTVERVDHQGPRLPATETRKGETWSVEVVPLVGDRRGSDDTEGLASAEIANTPPSLVTIGLSSYRPSPGEYVQAFVDGVEDADGDAPSIEFQWLIDDKPIADETADSLRLPADSKGELFELRVTLDDGEEEVSEDFGPWPLTPPAEWRWHRIAPNTAVVAGRGNFRSYDPRNRRVILAEASDNLWEFRLDPPRMWVPLFVRGAGPPSNLQGAHYDESHHRLIAFTIVEVDRYDPSPVFALDLSRGNESWTELEVEGEGPLPREGMASAVDGERNRLLFFGGTPRGEGETPRNDLWALNLDPEDPTKASWEELEPTGQPLPPVSDASIVVDSKRDRMLVLGGSANAFDVGVRPVYVVELEGLGVTSRAVYDQPPLDPRLRGRRP
ncbi:MAG: hypothetical protein KC416_02715 [Myxococcales bacterium]|nr:hypothetical protein [Myxococcales bacterium]